MGRDIRPAQLSDAAQVAACVKAAYQHYVSRMGKEPGPMRDDYAQIITDHSVWVIEGNEASCAGIVVLMAQSTGLLLDNVAVHPDYQGQGLGRQLMDFAEAEGRKRGYTDVELYTNEKMWENVEIYLKMGYVEVDRRVEKGYQRIYMRKQL